MRARLLRPDCHLTNVMLAGFGTDRLRCEAAMKTAGRENPNRWVATPSNRAHGEAGQDRSCSFKGAAKQEKIQPTEVCFFLTSPFREQTRHLGFRDIWPIIGR